MNRHHWPLACPDMPEDWHGWLCPNTKQALEVRLSASTRVVIECGTWLGVSARFIMEAAPNCQLYCIDTWKGSPEHAKKPDWNERLPRLFDTCQRNLWPWRERCQLIQADSLAGLAGLYDAGAKPDLILLDTLHTFGRVSAELYLCSELFPAAWIVADDLDMGDVKGACDMFARFTGRPMIEGGNARTFLPIG